MSPEPQATLKLLNALAQTKMPDEPDGLGSLARADGSAFWRDAINPENGAKIIAVYPSGSTVLFTETARKTTEGRDRAVNEVGYLRAALGELADMARNRTSTRVMLRDRIQEILSQNTKVTHDPLGGRCV